MAPSRNQQRVESDRDLVRMLLLIIVGIGCCAPASRRLGEVPALVLVGTLMVSFVWYALLSIRSDGDGGGLRRWVVGVVVVLVLAVITVAYCSCTLAVIDRRPAATARP